MKPDDQIQKKLVGSPVDECAKSKEKGRNGGATIPALGQGTGEEAADASS